MIKNEKFIKVLESKGIDISDVRQHGDYCLFEENPEEIHLLLGADTAACIEDPKIHSLRPIKDSYGILRTQTKIDQREDSENFLYPVILSSDHPVVQRLIYETHLENQHAGVSILMAHLREKFWILKSRKSIRNIIRKCVKCKRFNMSRIEVQPGMPPEDRVRDGAIFEVVELIICISHNQCQ
ncbi:integrase catalytic domain-containing protein [Nephila pilipes]|uniref:Integrase catalytic domain-containing protein n=1 Tax=Nephila pilipes TaxID=299642 RepID=A0A8X6MUT9_NEPPI|nr:integrase catalytic domain-containing protein [Nephila pilipes]